MHIISVSDFCLLEEHGGARSRGLSFRKNDWGVLRIFLVILGTHEDTIQPVQIDEPRNKILRTSQCSLHAPIFEGQATRSDNATDSARRTKEALHRQDSGSAEPSSCRRPTCENREAKSQDQGCPPKRVGIGDCTTKSASHGEPAGDRVRLSEE